MKSTMLTVLVCLGALVAPACQNRVSGPPATRPEIQVEIADVATNELEPGDTRAYGIFMIDVTYTNVGEGVATVIKPQDGSFYGWLSPTYDLTMTQDGDAEPLSFGGRCGNHGATYDGDSMVRIPAGESRTVTIPVPLSPSLPGTYRFILRYEVVPGRYPGPYYEALSTTEYEFKDWPAGVFTGEARSKEFVFVVE